MIDENKCAKLSLWGHRILISSFCSKLWFLRERPSYSLFSITVHVFHFFYYPPSSGIASCVGTAGMMTWCLHLTWPSRAGSDLGRESGLVIGATKAHWVFLMASIYAWFNIVSDTCHLEPYYLNSDKPFLTLTDWYNYPELGFKPGSSSEYLLEFG